MHNKIALKLTLYFAAVLLVFALVVLFAAAEGVPAPQRYF